jgi:tetratricopeptide (TPR) repeat protein
LRGARDRHAGWFAALGPQRAVLGACADLDNLVVACRRATAAGDGETATGALEGAWAALSLRGPFSAAVELGELVLQAPQMQPGTRVRAQLALAAALESLGRKVTATELYETALRSARSRDDWRPQVQASIRLARLHALAGLTEQAMQELAEALERARAMGDRALCAAALNLLGSVTFENGQLSVSGGHYEMALAEARAVGDLRLQGSLLGNLSHWHAELGHMREAQQFCEDALAISRQLGDLPRVGERLCGLGMMCHLQGDHARALEVSRSALVIARELGYARLECGTLGNIGTVEMALGDFDAAQDNLKAAWTLAVKLGDANLMREVQVQLDRLRAEVPGQTPMPDT